MTPPSPPLGVENVKIRENSEKIRGPPGGSLMDPLQPFLGPLAWLTVRQILVDHARNVGHPVFTIMWCKSRFSKTRPLPTFWGLETLLQFLEKLLCSLCSYWVCFGLRNFYQNNNNLKLRIVLCTQRWTWIIFRSTGLYRHILLSLDPCLYPSLLSSLVLTLLWCRIEGISWVLLYKLYNAL